MSIPLPDGLLRTPQGIHVLRDDSHLSRWIENHKRLDIAEGQIDFYKHLIPVGGTVIDAGASLGDHTLTYAKLVGPGGVVVAFEPNPLACAALALNFTAWKNVFIRNCALARESGRGTFNRQENAGASFITQGGGEFDGVMLEPLDWQRDLLDRCDFIHLDCEGMEHAALRGGSVLIADFKPAIVLEINHACLARNGLVEADVLALLDSYGYRWQELEPHLNTSFAQRDILALPR